MQQSGLETCILKNSEQPQQCLIWCHGLGADMRDFEDLIHALDIPGGCQLILPNAPIRPVSINMQMPMRAWYDIISLDRTGPEDTAGIEQAHQQLCSLIDQTITAGFDASCITLGGFSQGGAMALYTGIRYNKPLANIISVAGYLPLLAATPRAKEQMPTITMHHGHHDDVVQYQYGELSKETLEKQGYEVDWHSEACQHTMTASQVMQLKQLLIKGQ